MNKVLRTDKERQCPNCGVQYCDVDCQKQLERRPVEKIALRNLIRSGREVIIEHNNEDYCLRRTTRNRLILTKVKLSILLVSQADWLQGLQMVLVI